MSTRLVVNRYILFKNCFKLLLEDSWNTLQSVITCVKPDRLRYPCFIINKLYHSHHTYSIIPSRLSCHPRQDLIFHSPTHHRFFRLEISIIKNKRIIFHIYHFLNKLNVIQRNSHLQSILFHNIYNNWIMKQFFPVSCHLWIMIWSIPPIVSIITYFLWYF